MTSASAASPNRPSDLLSNPPPTPDESVAALLVQAAAADLPLSRERAAQLVPALIATRELLGALDRGDLGELAPSAPFSAHWEAR